MQFAVAAKVDRNLKQSMSALPQMRFITNQISDSARAEPTFSAYVIYILISLTRYSNIV